jgi:phage terminase large subunit
MIDLRSHQDALQPRPVKRLTLGYEARPHFAPFHARRQRWAVIVAHRRAGKTVACVMDLIDAALRSTKTRPRYAYVAPQLKQAKTVAWDYLRYYGLRVPGATAHETELRLDLPNGGQVRLYGSDNPDALRGIYLDGLVLDEAADTSPRVFNEILRPALSDREGWCVWIGTPKGENDFFDLWQEARRDPERYFTLMLRASQTGIVPQDELDDARRSMTPEQYQQEFEGSFSAAIIGAYYGREMQAAEDEGRITTSVYDKGLAVHTAWDLGMSDHTSIWFYQQAGFETRLIDYYASNGYGLDHYTDLLQRKPYRYGAHYLPHDVDVKELGTGRSRLETLRSLGLEVSVVPKLPVEDGRNAVRRILPRCWFDRDKCEEGIKALRQYRRQYDDVRKTFLERHYHDWSAHPADAFRYLAVSLQEPRALHINGKALPKRSYGWVV